MGFNRADFYDAELRRHDECFRAAVDETLQRLRAMLHAHLTAEGVFFDPRAWIVTARRNN